jgi:hypothetical protein
MTALLAEYGIYAFRHGGAKGADNLGKYIAENILRLTDIDEYKADWDQYDKAAGPIRNRQMLDTEIRKGKDTILVIAFPLEDSIGSWDMINYARSLQVEVRIYDTKGKEI